MTEARGKSAYLPTLDGWRAISILAVIFHHDSVHSLGPFSTRWLYVFGYSGVDVFFAISGILICSRLLDEERIDGSIYFGRFYIRRFFRILPPAILYLLVISSLAAFAIIPVSFGEVLESLFFCRNYPSILGWGQATQVGWYTGHFWSLAIEEQFYFIFPALIAFCSKRFRIAVLGSLALLIAVHRDIALNARPWELISRHPDVRLDSLVVPALFAVLASNPRIRVLLRGFLRFWPLLVLANLCVLPVGIGTSWHDSIQVVLIPCIVLGSVLNPGNFLGRVLEWRMLRYIGRISYSLYLWQQLFFIQHFVGGDPLRVWQSWPLRLVMTSACAMTSYYLLERPLARLGHRLAPSATPGREDLDKGSPNDLAKAPLSYRDA